MGGCIFEFEPVFVLRLGIHLNLLNEKLIEISTLSATRLICGSEYLS